MEQRKRINILDLQTSGTFELPQDLRHQLRTYLVEQSGDHDLAVSLTMKQQDGPTSLNAFEAEKNLRHFLNRLNKRAFGNAAARFGRRVPVVPMLERSLSDRWHYHLTIKNPFPDEAACRAAVRDCWAKTRWGYNEVDSRPLHDAEGWINYITKSRSIDGWDIVNTNLVC